jgi:hypothetical protein
VNKSRRIFIIADITHKPAKMFLNQAPKLGKGLIRLGHDVRYFSYCSALMELSWFKSRTLARIFYKSAVDELLAGELAGYSPDIVFIALPRVLDAESVDKMRQAAPNAIFIGIDGDLWPDLRRERINVAKKLDILTATNEGDSLQAYRDAGVPKCVFMPNMCDPDTDHRYQVGRQWQTNILWTGLIRHDPKRYPGETMRYELVNRIAAMPDCSVYGCCGRPKVGGINYLYAISGAKIGLSINGDNNIPLYHSDRLTNYLACGTCVLAKRVPRSDLLFKDGRHLRYFDTIDEFFELAKWLLEHEDERKRIADAGMKWTHEQYNCVKIAGLLLDLSQNGTYVAPWTGAL